MLATSFARSCGSGRVVVLRLICELEVDRDVGARPWLEVQLGLKQVGLETSNMWPWPSYSTWRDVLAEVMFLERNVHHEKD